MRSHRHSLLFVSVAVGGWSGRDCWCAFVTHGSVFLNCRRKANSQLLPPPLFLECVSSGTPLRMHFIKLHWFVLGVPGGYLFASKGFLIPLAPTSLSRLMQVLSIDQLLRTQSS